MIFERKTLFHFSYIAHEAGAYDHDFRPYEPYISPQPLLMEHLPEKYGRAAFAHLMAMKSTRLFAVEALLRAQGIEPTATAVCWEDIGRWCGEHIEENREPALAELGFAKGRFVALEAVFRPLWYSILIDLCLLLGEHVISRRPGCSWQFWGDMNIKNPGGFGRSPWVLCEPLPSGKWQHKPNRFLPYELLSASAAVMLRNKLAGKAAAFSWGEQFSALIAAPAEAEASDDKWVARLCEWLEEYNQGQPPSAIGAEDRAEQMQALDEFLRSYMDDHGVLPPKSDLKKLRDSFGGMPDWVDMKSGAGQI